MPKAVPASSDIWYGSVEDLLSALDRGKATAVSSALTINLQTSAIPLSLALKGALKFEGLHVYALQQVWDNGSSQFQLRLGIIESDLEADAILATVRQHYPGATKRFAGEADRTEIARMNSAARHKGRAAVGPSSRAPLPGLPRHDLEVNSKSKMISATQDLQWNIDEVLTQLGSNLQVPRPANPVHPRSVRPTVPGAQLAKRPMQSAQPSARVVYIANTSQDSAAKDVNPEASEPAHRDQRSSSMIPTGGRPSTEMGMSTQPSTTDSGELRSIVDKIQALSTTAEVHREALAATSGRTAALIPSMPAPAQVRTPVKSSATLDLAPATSTEMRNAPLPMARVKPPAIDSTQTVRALTVSEIDDSEASRWFVIQLIHSPDRIDPEQIPDLDIFSEYRLYAVAETDPSQAGNALRLGFFSSEVAAQAVASYLARHFPATTIKRVSVAEHDRFAQNLVVAKKDVGEAGRHSVIECSGPPDLPMPSGDNPAPLEANKVPPQATNSLWSRLITRRAAR